MSRNCYTRIKHVATDLMICAEETGYEYDFLCDEVNDCIEDGYTMVEAVNLILGIAYEYDL